MRRIVAVILLLTPVGAWAEDEEEASGPLSTVSAEDRKAEKIVEVEHGFYIGVESGLSLLLAPGGAAIGPNATLVHEGLDTGQSVGVELGFEPIPMISLGVIVTGTNTGTSALYVGTQVFSTSTGPNCALACGNVSTLTLGANGRFNLSLGEDGNGQRRTYLYLRVGAGYTLARPSGILANELTLFGGPGIEYFTHLRHFSIGFEVLPSFGLTNKGFALLAQPVVRYSF